MLLCVILTMDIKSYLSYRVCWFLEIVELRALCWMEAFVFVQVKQREDDTQCSKMMLRFREDKIKRLESLSAGFLTAELYLMQEKNTLVEELQLLQAKIDRNPELTRFAMENIRLLEQLRRFADNLLPMAFNFTFYVLLSRNRMHRNLTSLYLHKWLTMASTRPLMYRWWGIHFVQVPGFLHRWREGSHGWRDIQLEGSGSESYCLLTFDTHRTENEHKIVTGLRWQINKRLFFFPSEKHYNGVTCSWLDHNGFCSYWTCWIVNSRLMLSLLRRFKPLVVFLLPLCFWMFSQIFF